MESITVPCLKILLKLVKPPSPSSKTNKVGFFVYTTGILDISKQTFADVNVLFFRLIGRFCPFLKQTSKPANSKSKTTTKAAKQLKESFGCGCISVYETLA